MKKHTPVKVTAASAINTHVRLFDLVRYMRQELHAADLINDEEYSWLCLESDMARSSKGGSPSPRRLEDYDELRKRSDLAFAACRSIRFATEQAVRHGGDYSLNDLLAADKLARDALKPAKKGGAA